MTLLPQDLALDKEGLEARISEVERTYEQTNEQLATATGRKQDVLVERLASCGNYLQELKDHLKHM
jgi:hypothetical protein